MSNLKTKLPQVSRVQGSESHTEHSVSSKDSGGSNSSNRKPLRQKLLKSNAPLYIATYNTRTLRTREHLEEFEEELSHIKWDIIGVCETRLPGERCTTLQTGHTLYQNNAEERDYIGGVAIIINKNFKHNVIKYQAISERVIYITIKLNKRYHLQIIQAYAPTSKAEEEEIERFYEDLTKARQMEKAHFVIVMGDFNAKIGERKQGDTDYVGNFGLGERNERGETLTNYLDKENLYCLNTFFKKPKQRKWTWRSPDNKTRNEIDFILSNKKTICRDVSVLNRFNTGSDHRLVRAKIKINTAIERKKLLKNHRYPTSDVLQLKEAEYQNDLNQKLTKVKLEQLEIDELANKITSSVKTSVKKICAGTKNHKDTKLSQDTLKLLEKRRNAEDRTTQEYMDLNKQVKKGIRRDKRMYNAKLIEETIKDNCKMKVLSKKLSMGKAKITKMRNENNIIVHNKYDIIKSIEMFYTGLYSSKSQKTVKKINIMNVGSEDLPEITEGEISATLKQMKSNRCPGEDQVTTEMLKLGGKTLHKTIKILLNKCLHAGKIPTEWCNSEVVLLFKKGDNTSIENYRPISLLSHLYKLFTKIITNRLTSKLDFYQPVEQAGFRKGYSTIDHLYTVRTLIEKCTEYNVPLHLAFVDFQKAFDTIESWSILNALQNARIDSRYTQIIESIYKEATIHIRLDETTTTNKIPLERGVRQGDTISPKLFTLALEDIFKKLEWNTKGINVDGFRLNHLRFADDIVLISNNATELQEMLNELNLAAINIGLNMNYSKTKIMSSEDINIYIQDNNIECVNEYIYLGHTIKLGKENQHAEINRRIRLTWAAFGKLGHILKNNMIPINLKRKVYNTCVLPVQTYGLETISLTKAFANKLLTTQRAMERSMLGISLRDKIRSEDIRRQTRVADIIQEAAKMKWQWAGHLARLDTDRWAHKITVWRPRQTKRSMGRPQKRWVDDIKRVAGRNWLSTARNRETWKRMRETYIQEWTAMG